MDNWIFDRIKQGLEYDAQSCAMALDIDLEEARTGRLFTPAAWFDCYAQAGIGREFIR